jgi:hypothetical protein
MTDIVRPGGFGTLYRLSGDAVAAGYNPSLVVRSGLRRSFSPAAMGRSGPRLRVSAYGGGTAWASGTVALRRLLAELGAGIREVRPGAD